MPKKRHTEAQIISILRESDGELTVSELCRKHAITTNTFYRWKKTYGGMEPNHARELKGLRTENGKLKKKLGHANIGTTRPYGRKGSPTSMVNCGINCCGSDDPFWVDQFSAGAGQSATSGIRFWSLCFSLKDNPASQQNSSHPNRQEAKPPKKITGHCGIPWISKLRMPENPGVQPLAMPNGRGSEIRNWNMLHTLQPMANHLQIIKNWPKGLNLHIP